MTWTPLGSDADSHPTLVDGIPPWLKRPVRDWFSDRFVEKRYSPEPEDEFDYTLVARVDRMRRYDIAARSYRQSFADVLEAKMPAEVFEHLSERDALNIIDWVVRDNVLRGEDGNSELEALLLDGGSRWRVGTRNGQPGLEERVPLGLQDAADAIMTSPGEAGRLLSEAWHAVYGIQPRPDLGYDRAVKAVEAAVLPIVKPRDGSATLGKAIGQMRADGDWKLPFVKEHAENPSQGVILGLLQALWSGHSDRHPGTPTYIASTQEAAEAAVALAVTIVTLFGSGGIARR